MQMESAAARRRRRIYHQRSLQGSGGSLVTEQLIPEVDNEDDEDDEDTIQQDERTSLIRHRTPPGETTHDAGSSPRLPVKSRFQQRLYLQHQHSAPLSGTGADWGSEIYLNMHGEDTLEEPVLVAGSRGGEQGEEQVESHEVLAARRQLQQQQQHRALSASVSHSPRARRAVNTSVCSNQHQPLTATSSATGRFQTAAAAGAAHPHCVPGAAQRVLQHQQPHSTSLQQVDGQDIMTITPSVAAHSRPHHRAASTSSSTTCSSSLDRGMSPSPAATTCGGGGSAAGSNGAGAASASSSHSLASPHTSALTGGAGGAALSPTGGGLAAGGQRTPVVKKRTRFHQRSVTMMPGTSPLMAGPGVMSDEVGLIDREDRHGHHPHSLDLAATYHSGMSGSSTHRSHHGHHRGKTTAVHHTTRQHHHTSGGKTNTPSLLFTKVKERIREKVFQSSEWPNAAAMMHEKRQRANDMLEASLNSRRNLNLEQIQLHGKQRKKMTTLRAKSDSGKFPTTSGGSQTGLHSDPIVVAPSAQHSTSLEASTSIEDQDSPDREVVRDAFRRRSISEDTYDRQPCVVMKKNGVVCSSEDLEYIMQEQQSIVNSKAYRKKGSPRPLKKHLRTQSLDIARLTALENRPQGQTSHSSIYLDPQVSMESSSSTVSSVRTIDSASENDIHLRSSSAQQLDMSGHSDTLHSPAGNLYPEIVLDDKSKETIMEETKDGQAPDKVSLDEDNTNSEGKNTNSQPVPEIVFDENGQTWDVYGAEFDPEVLGIAIQRHLETMMERMMAPTINEEDVALTLGSTCSMTGTESQVEASKGENNSFWVRLLCLFAGRNEGVAT